MASNPEGADTTDVRVFRTGPLFDHNYGFDVLHKDLFRPFVPAVLRNSYFRPWRHQYFRSSGISNIQDSEDGYKVNLDVQQFRPEEINVKIVGNQVVVEGKHKERQDEHGFVSRQFQRRYELPKDIVLDAVVSKLSCDGVLSIEAPKKTVDSPPTERVIPITHTNAPAATSAPSAQGTKEKVSAAMTD